MQQALQLLHTSRPRFWFYLAGPWVVGYLLIAQRPLDLITSPLFWLGLAVWILPANFFLYGVNDLADQDTDQFNQRKLGYEQDGSVLETVWGKALLWISLLALLWFGFLLPPAGAAVHGLFLLLAASYSLPPLRFKARPLIDAYSNILYALPAFVAVSLSPTNQVGSVHPFWFWAIVVGVLTWNAGMHTFSALPDITADKKAGLETTATWLGKNKGLWFVIFNWSISASIVILSLGWLATPFLIYPLIAWTIQRHSFSVARFYPYFPRLNLVMGTYLYWLILSQKFTFMALWQDAVLLFLH